MRSNLDLIGAARLYHARLSEVKALELELRDAQAAFRTNMNCIAESSPRDACAARAALRAANAELSHRAAAAG